VSWPVWREPFPLMSLQTCVLSVLRYSVLNGRPGRATNVKSTARLEAVVSAQRILHLRGSCFDVRLLSGLRGLQ
jgi:hypothetical protein